MLELVKDNVGIGKFKDLQQTCGINYKPHGLIAEKFLCAGTSHQSTTVLKTPFIVSIHMVVLDSGSSPGFRGR